jgi:hypothetical protein
MSGYGIRDNDRDDYDECYIHTPLTPMTLNKLNQLTSTRALNIISLIILISSLVPSSITATPTEQIIQNLNGLTTPNKELWITEIKSLSGGTDVKSLTPSFIKVYQELDAITPIMVKSSELYNTELSEKINQDLIKISEIVAIITDELKIAVTSKQDSLKSCMSTSMKQISADAGKYVDDKMIKAQATVDKVSDSIKGSLDSTIAKSDPNASIKQAMMSHGAKLLRGWFKQFKLACEI